MKRQSIFGLTNVETGELEQLSGDDVYFAISDAQKEVERRKRDYQEDYAITEFSSAPAIVPEHMPKWKAKIDPLSAKVWDDCVNQMVLLNNGRAVNQVVLWLNEDELPEGYPYDEMFPQSKVDIVRLFPVVAMVPAKITMSAMIKPDDFAKQYLCKPEPEKSKGAIEADELLASGWTEHSGGRFPDNCHLRVVNDRGHYRQFFKLIDQPVEYGWKGWRGGDCPVLGDVIVDVELRSGRFQYDVMAKNLAWDYRAGRDNISAYRVVNS